MSIWSIASNASAWRGYEYYQQGKVTSYTTLCDDVFESYIQGSADAPYHTVINISHPRNSQCNCPFAKDRRVACKHMVALLFSVRPSEAEAYMRAIEESEMEYERWRQEHYRDIEQYVRDLSKDDLRNQLVNALIELDERGDRYW